MKVVLYRRIAWGALLAAVAASSAGCGGFNGSYSASPASLFLQNRPAVKPPVLLPAEKVEASAAPAASSGSWARTVTID